MNLILGILLVLIVLLLLLPVRVSGYFSYLGGEVKYSLRAGLGPVMVNLNKLIAKVKEKPKEEKPATEKEKKPLSFSDIENSLQKGVSALQYLRKRFTVSLFSFKAKFSLGDAADTGIATGAAYGSIYTILGAIDRYFVLKKQEVIITPVFEGVGLETELRGEFRLRLIWCLGLLLKVRKGDAK